MIQRDNGDGTYSSFDQEVPPPVQPWRKWATGDAVALLGAREHVVTALEYLAAAPANRDTARLFSDLRDIRDTLETLARKVSSEARHIAAIANYQATPSAAGND